MSDTETFYVKKFVKAKNVPLNRTTVNELKTLEIQYFRKTRKMGVAISFFEKLLEETAPETWLEQANDIISVVKYWIDYIRKEITDAPDHWWDFLTRILKFLMELCEKHTSIPGRLVELMSDSLLDLACKDFKPEQIYMVLHFFNMFCSFSTRECRLKQKPKIAQYFPKLGRLLSTSSHFPVQFATLEAIVRWIVPRDQPSLRAAASYFPRLHQAARNIFVNSRWLDFTKNAREFLHSVNETSKLVTSVKCQRICVGDDEVCPDRESSQTWLDINMSDGTLSVVLEPRALLRLVGLHSTSWEALVVHATAVSLRSGSSEVIISLKTEQPPLVQPSCLPLAGSDITILVSSQTNVDSLNDVLQTVYKEKFIRLTDGPFTVPTFSPAHYPDWNKTANDSRTTSKNSGSSTTTSSLVQLRAKLQELQPYNFDKERQGVCALPDLSDVNEKSLESYKLKHFGVCHIRSGSASDTHLNRNQKSRADTGSVYEGSPTSLVHPVTLDTKKTSDNNAKDNIVDLLFQESFNPAKAVSQKENQVNRKKVTVISDTSVFVTTRKMHSNKRGVHFEPNSDDMNAITATDIHQNVEIDKIRNKVHCNFDNKQNAKEDFNAEFVEMQDDPVIPTASEHKEPENIRPRRVRKPSLKALDLSPEMNNKRRRKLYSPKDDLEFVDSNDADFGTEPSSHKNRELDFDKLLASEDHQKTQTNVSKNDIYNFNSDSDAEDFIQKQQQVKKRPSRGTKKSKNPTRKRPAKKAAVRQTNKIPSTEAELPSKRITRLSSRNIDKSIEPLSEHLKDERMRSSNTKRDLESSFIIEKPPKNKKPPTYESNPKMQPCPEIISDANIFKRKIKRSQSTDTRCKPKSSEATTTRKLSVTPSDGSSSISMSLNVENTAKINSWEGNRMDVGDDSFYDIGNLNNGKIHLINDEIIEEFENLPAVQNRPDTEVNQGTEHKKEIQETTKNNKKQPAKRRKTISEDDDRDNDIDMTREPVFIRESSSSPNIETLIEDIEGRELTDEQKKNFTRIDPIRSKKRRVSVVLDRDSINKSTVTHKKYPTCNLAEVESVPIKSQGNVATQTSFDLKKNPPNRDSRKAGSWIDKADEPIASTSKYMDNTSKDVEPSTSDLLSNTIEKLTNIHDSLTTSMEEENEKFIKYLKLNFVEYQHKFETLGRKCVLDMQRQLQKFLNRWEKEHKELTNSVSENNYNLAGKTYDTIRGLQDKLNEQVQDVINDVTELKRTCHK